MFGSNNIMWYVYPYLCMYEQYISKLLISYYIWEEGG